MRSVARAYPPAVWPGHRLSAVAARGGLAVWANVRAALAHDEAGDGVVAARAGFPGAAKDAQSILVASAAASHAVEVGRAAPEGGALGSDAAAQDGADGGVQGAEFSRFEGVAAAAWMQARRPQGFVDVDVSESGDDVLIQQEGLQHAGVTGQLPAQDGGSEGRFERFGAQLARNRRGVRHQMPAPEFSRVVIAQIASIVQVQDHVFVLVARQGVCGKAQATAHAQMDEEGLASREGDGDVLGPTGDGAYGLAAKTGRQRGGRWRGDRAGPMDGRLEDASSDQLFPPQVAYDRFHFGEFWHDGTAILRRLRRPRRRQIWGESAPALGGFS